jgi:peptidoglycan hydrolase FlgJ
MRVTGLRVESRRACEGVFPTMQIAPNPAVPADSSAFRTVLLDTQPALQAGMQPALQAGFTLKETGGAQPPAPHMLAQELHPDRLELSPEALSDPGTPLEEDAIAREQARRALSQAGVVEPQLRDVFQDFVGQTFFSELLKSLRSTQGKPAYFHGGRTEEIFQGQLDQVLTEHLSDSSAHAFSEPMFELFQLRRGQTG